VIPVLRRGINVCRRYCGVEPAKTFPRAMGIAVVAITVTYLVPIAVAVGVAPRVDYCDGCLVNIASTVAGPWCVLYV